MGMIRKWQFKGFLPDIFIGAAVFPRNETVVFYTEIDERLYRCWMLPRDMRVEQQRFKAFKRVVLLYALFKQRKKLPCLLFAELKAKPKFRRDIPYCELPLKVWYGIFYAGNTERNLVAGNTARQELLNRERGSANFFPHGGEWDKRRRFRHKGRGGEYRYFRAICQ